MSDSPNILHKAFITMNFEDFDKFSDSFACDEIVFMQYLIYKCYTNKNGEWWHSASKISSKLKIKKARLASIIKRFEAEGWLITQTKGFKNSRHFTLDFSKLHTVEFLSQFYKLKALTKLQKESIAEVFRTLETNYTAIGTDQESAEPKGNVSTTTVNYLADRLEKLFVERRKEYRANREKEGGWVPRDIRLTFSPDHKKRLHAALVYFNGNVELIYSAFISYCDHINYADGQQLSALGSLVRGFDKPSKDIIAYFLSSKSAYSTINSFFTASTEYGHNVDIDAPF